MQHTANKLYTHSTKMHAPQQHFNYITTKTVIQSLLVVSYDTIRCDMMHYFNMRSKAAMSQLNLPHWTNKFWVKNYKWKRICSEVLVTVWGVSPEVGRLLYGKQSIEFATRLAATGTQDDIWDHTALSANRQRWHSRPYPSRNRYGGSLAEMEVISLAWKVRVINDDSGE